MLRIRIVVINMNMLDAAGRTATLVGSKILPGDLVHFGIFWRGPRQLEPDRSAMDTVPDTDAIPLPCRPVERASNRDRRAGIALVVMVQPVVDRHVVDHHLRPIVVLDVKLITPRCGGLDLARPLSGPDVGSNTSRSIRRIIAAKKPGIIGVDDIVPRPIDLRGERLSVLSMRLPTGADS